VCVQLVDCENHEKNKEEPMFASEGLQRLVTKYQRHSAKDAKAQQEAAGQLKQKLNGEEVAPDEVELEEHKPVAVHENKKDTAAHQHDSSARPGSKQAW
jgi:hypothetical protein